MNFKTWYNWLRSKPWALRWFIVLILIRPIIDNFFYLKEISPLLSPLNWAGLLTPLLCLPPIINYSYKRNIIHWLFNKWSILILINSLLLIFQPIDYISLSQWVLKLSLPVFLFAFLRIFIHNKSDLNGLLTTFLYAAGIAASILFYELVFNPIKLGYSRGIERLQGGYADVMNYAIYLSFGFAVLTYYFIVYKTTKRGIQISLLGLIFAGIFCVAGLIGISHTASYTVFAAICLLLIILLAKKYIFISIFIIGLFWIFISTYGDKFYQQRIQPLVEKEYEVIQGERDQEQLFHGRMARWKYAWNNFKGSPIHVWLFGFPLSLKDPFFNISIGIHNDFLRIFYFTGIIGIMLYLFFLYGLYRRKRYLLIPEKFLLYATLIILLLYSISTTPTFYPNFLYILFIVFAYFSLSPIRLKINE